MSHHYLFVSLKKITVKSKCWMEKMSTTNYCQLWSRSLRKSTQPPPLPTLSSWAPRQSELNLTTMSAGKTTLQTCRQTLQRTSSALDVLRYVEQVAAVQNKRPARAVPSSANAKRSEGVYRSNSLVISDSVRIVSSFGSEFGTHSSTRFY